MLRILAGPARIVGGLARIGVVPALLVATVATAPAAQAELLSSTIQPGTRISEVITDPPAASACRVGFVYDGTGGLAGHTYVSTAAHCVLSVGDQIRLTDTGEVFGDVVAVGDVATSATDWALIEVLPAFLGRVSAAMLGSPDYPTGVTSPAQTHPGDTIQLVPLPLIGPRQGTLAYDDAEIYRISGPVVPSDSGGPLAHVPTGGALGQVSRGLNCSATVCEQYEGPTVQGILAKVAAAGFQVILRTV